MHKVPLTVYCVWFRDHIHTQEDGKLAIFDKLKDANQWMGGKGDAECKVRKMQVVPYKPVEKKRVR